MLMRTSASRSALVKACDVNWLPLSVLKISGFELPQQRKSWGFWPEFA